MICSRLSTTRRKESVDTLSSITMVRISAENYRNDHCILGIPIKRDAKNITYEKSVQYAALITDLWNTTKRDIQNTSRNADV